MRISLRGFLLASSGMNFKFHKIKKKIFIIFKQISFYIIYLAKKPDFEVLRLIFRNVLLLLKEKHRSGFVHMALHPKNIIISRNYSIELI